MTIEDTLRNIVNNGVKRIEGKIEELERLKKEGVRVLEETEERARNLLLFVKDLQEMKIQETASAIFIGQQKVQIDTHLQYASLRLGTPAGEIFFELFDGAHGVPDPRVIPGKYSALVVLRRIPE